MATRAHLPGQTAMPVLTVALPDAQRLPAEARASRQPVKHPQPAGIGLRLMSASVSRT